MARLLAGLDGALCVVSRSGVIRSANSAFALLAGCPPAALQGMALQALLSAEAGPALQARLADPEGGDAP
ncbi:MAG TPA: PAS domain-containing protein, partial [Albitalea sp.]|nr:PAS domain-containing protein [Albitalea sp.]